jgi:hypothetical protein
VFWLAVHRSRRHPKPLSAVVPVPFRALLIRSGGSLRPKNSSAPQRLA